MKSATDTVARQVQKVNLNLNRVIEVWKVFLNAQEDKTSSNQTTSAQCTNNNNLFEIAGW